MQTVNAWKLTFRENKPLCSSQKQTAGSHESYTRSTTCVSYYKNTYTSVTMDACLPYVVMTQIKHKSKDKAAEH